MKVRYRRESKCRQAYPSITVAKLRLGGNVQIFYYGGISISYPSFLNFHNAQICPKFRHSLLPVVFSSVAASAPRHSSGTGLGRPASGIGELL